MQIDQKIANLKQAVSIYDKYCDGYGNTNPNGNGYILGINLGIGISNFDLSHSGSTMLDEINAFDLAEVDSAYIGQLNMSIVSSFCGPQGLIWGYDVAKTDCEMVKSLEYKGKQLNVFDGQNLIAATTKLFGTVNEQRYILRPGAHVPFASKNKKITKPGLIYAAIAIGIPHDRVNNACLLMEDIGEFSINTTQDTVTETIRTNLAKSIIQVGLNQKVEFKECLVAFKTCAVGENEVGCALVAAPYITLAQKAIPTKDDQYDFEYLANCSLIEWEDRIIETK